MEDQNQLKSEAYRQLKGCDRYMVTDVPSSTSLARELTSIPGFYKVKCSSFLSVISITPEM